MDRNSFGFSTIIKRSARRRNRQSFILVLALLNLVFLLAGCGHPTNTAGSTKPKPSATSSTPAPMEVQQTHMYEFTAQDSGKTVIYVVTSRFGITFNSRYYPNIRNSIYTFLVRLLVPLEASRIFLRSSLLYMQCAIKPYSLASVPSQTGTLFSRSRSFHCRIERNAMACL
jgi:hypothetical protein